jgi:hypothetical protein
MKLWMTTALLALGACGEDTQNDDLPNWLTGLSGIVIAIIVGILLIRAINRRR